MTRATEAEGVSSRLYRDLDYPHVDNFSELLFLHVGQSRGEEGHFIHELSPVFVQHEESNLEAKLEQMCLLLHSSHK